MESGESQFSVAAVPGCADRVRSTIIEYLTGKCALYLTTLLRAMFPQAQELLDSDEDE